MALITTVDILGHPKMIDECSEQDIPGHFELIKHWVPEDEHEEFQERMLECVRQQRAYTMLSSNTFLYYMDKCPKQVIGVALYGKESPIDLLALFLGVFEFIDKDVFIMYFKLHPGKYIQEYKCLVTEVSAKRSAQDPEHPLAVRIDHIKSRIKAIHSTRGFV